MDFYQISACVYACILVLGILLYCYKFHFWKYGKRKQKVLPAAEQNKKYAVLIPARDESKVIADLLDSISIQTYNKDNLQTFVIVADSTDPTIDICKKYANTSCYTLPHKVGSKGATLQLMIKEIKNRGLSYDGYFILDADNVLNPDFIELMHNALCSGKDLVLGGRLNKQPSGNWINCGSTLTWTYLNTLNNKCRSENGANINVQGSPLLISRSIIEDFFGYDWPLTSLTEDVELAFICDINNFKTFYYEYALAYDEQPKTYKQSVNQRLRWIKGHNSVNVKYKPTFAKTKCKYVTGIYKFDKLFPLLAPIIIVVSSGIFALYSGVMAIVLALLGNSFYIWPLIGFAITLAAIYFVLAFWSLFAIVTDKQKLGLSFKQRLQAFFTVPIYFLSYVPIYIKSFFIKDVKWTKVEHNQKKKVK